MIFHWLLLLQRFSYSTGWFMPNVYVNHFKVILRRNHLDRGNQFAFHYGGARGNLSRIELREDLSQMNHRESVAIVKFGICIFIKSCKASSELGCKENFVCALVMERKRFLNEFFNAQSLQSCCQEIYAGSVRTTADNLLMQLHNKLCLFIAFINRFVAASRQ